MSSLITRIAALLFMLTLALPVPAAPSSARSAAGSTARSTVQTPASPASSAARSTAPTIRPHGAPTARSSVSASVKPTGTHDLKNPIWTLGLTGTAYYRNPCDDARGGRPPLFSRPGDRTARSIEADEADLIGCWTLQAAASATVYLWRWNDITGYWDYIESTSSAWDGGYKFQQLDQGYYAVDFYPADNCHYMSSEYVTLSGGWAVGVDTVMEYNEACGL